MIVDDNLFMQKLISSFISEEPCLKIVSTAATSEEAIRKFKELRPEVVLLDISLPDRNGIVTLAEIMKIDRHALVIMVSALKEYAADSFNIGAADFIAKPFTKEKLINAIKSKLGM